jgi:hypothetical protein
MSYGKKMKWVQETLCCGLNHNLYFFPFFKKMKHQGQGYQNRNPCDTKHKLN